MKLWVFFKDLLATQHIFLNVFFFWVGVKEMVEELDVVLDKYKKRLMYG